ncbi:MAG: hypothetical protein M1290_01810 [Candidatus Thermoplasmatota archaeon]|jgi:GT2 family glycosyltransferase|nr:hypothetical protein [Candidatus Thermoplasmatota archaeon]
MEFYKGFESREELIEWMRERPKGSSYIYEVEGDKDIIVVIPTADYDGNYSRNCRENIFKGLHIIFVESGVGNYYFNYAHNCNVGIRKAMEYDPKWIVVSNDDVYKIDDIDILKGQLLALPQKDSTIVYLEPPGKYYSYWAFIGKPSTLRRLFYLLNRYLRLRIRIEKEYARILGLKFLVFGTNIPYRFLVKHDLKFRNVGGFVIFNRKLAEEKQGNIFDETYINGTEDVDFSLQIAGANIKVNTINYKIGCHIGASLGKSTSNRTLRDIITLAYFNQKISEGSLKLPYENR